MGGIETEDRTEIVYGALKALILIGVVATVLLVGILVVGMVARIEELSAGSFMQFVLIGVLLWPVYRLAPWRSDLTERVRRWFRSHPWPVAVTAALILWSQLPVAPDLLTWLVLLPFGRTAGLFFGVELFYRPYVGFQTGTLIRNFGQWYVTTLFVFFVSVFILWVGEWVRSAVSNVS